MKIPVFKLENYFQKFEFSVPYQFCNSDMESLSLKELTSLADPAGKRLWENLSCGYTEVSGSSPLLEEVSHLYRNIHPNQILTFSGGEEGIFSLYQILLDPKDHFIVVTPCYQSHQSIPESMGCEISCIQLTPEQGWKLDLEQLRNQIRPTTKMVTINFPHNPTGATLSESEIQELIQICRKNGTYLFSDEAYRFSETDPRYAMTPIADLYERGVSLGVLSKAFGLAGLRIGWIATQDRDLIQRLMQMKHYLSICGSAPSEVLGIIALRAKEAILKRNQQITKDNLALLDSFYEKYPRHIRWVRPRGGCVGFPELTVNDSIENIAKRLAHEEGVLILPGSIYDWPGNFFRMGFGRKNMPQALEKFEKFMQKLEVK